MNNEINLRTLCTGVYDERAKTRRRSHDFCQTRPLTRLPLQHPAPVTPKHGGKPNKPDVFYSRRIPGISVSFKRSFLRLRQLVFPSHIVTEHLVFCIQCDSHHVHWFVEEWHQVSSSRIADSVYLGLQWSYVGGDSCTDIHWFQWSQLANVRNGRNEFWKYLSRCVFEPSKGSSSASKCGI